MISSTRKTLLQSQTVETSSIEPVNCRPTIEAVTQPDVLRANGMEYRVDDADFPERAGRQAGGARRQSSLS